MNFSKEYLDDILVRLAHHSSAIEGNTITLSETVTMILDGTIPGTKPFKNREFFEIVNHKQAFDFICHEIDNGNKLSIETIKKIHELLTDRLQHDKGQFKKSENTMIGIEFQTATPKEVPQLVQQLIDNLDYRMEESRTEYEKVAIILEAHAAFEKIHPFSDGNGRTGRMVMNYSLLGNGLPPLIFQGKDKDIYKMLLHNIQVEMFPKEEDVKRLVAFAKPLLENEKSRQKMFLNKEKNQIGDLEIDS